MKALITATLCAGLAALTVTAANAAPPGHGGHLGTSLAERSLVTAVRDDDGKHKFGKDHDRKRKFGDSDRHDRRHYDRRHYDRRYDKYRGWHRYDKRPYGWRQRGCVVVGPIWFCP